MEKGDNDGWCNALKNLVLRITLFTVLTLLFVNMHFMTANAVHTMKVTVSPAYYQGGAEIKTINVTNTALPGGDSITKVLIVFPSVQPGDSDYEPVNYTVIISCKPNAQWSATYEPGLRQVTFEVIDVNGAIPPGCFGLFIIGFSDGPRTEGEYTWTISTTDNHLQGHTVYVSQWIDRSPPIVTIDYPPDGAVVNGTIELDTGVDPPTITDYTWVNVTAYDNPVGSGSGIKQVTISLDGGSLIDITNNKWTIDGISYHYWYKWTSPALESHTIVVVAEDYVGLTSTDPHAFAYQLVIPEFPSIILLLPIVILSIVVAGLAGRRSRRGCLNSSICTPGKEPVAQ
jgi:hypothetical protein